MTRPTLPGRVLVTGSHRSGTTWVGRMLALSRELTYVNEPFNVVNTGRWLKTTLPHQYLYVCADNAAAYREPLERVAELRYPLLAPAGPGGPRSHLRTWAAAQRGRRAGRPALFKDPIALFSTPWLAAELGFHPVVLVRHPAAFVGSLKRLDWRFDVREWLDQPLLVRDLIGSHADALQAHAERPGDLVTEAILQWNVMYDVVRRFRDEHPEWTVLRYEDLAADAVEGFRALSGRLGLTYDDATAEQVRAHSSAENPSDDPAAMEIRRDSRRAARTWRDRLSAEETDRVRAGTAEVAAAFYGDADWD